MGNKFLSSKLQPQVFSLILVTIILIIISIVVFVKAKKQKPDKAPKGILVVAEQYVMGVDGLFKEATGGKINKLAPYIFTLISLLIVSNLISLLGFEAPATTYSFTFVLALVTWIGIFVVGMVFQKLKFFKRFLNPLGVVGEVAPLISLSFRLFGNIIGGSTIMYLLYAVTSWVWGFIPVVGEFNLLGPIITPALHLYFDIFQGLIQAFVFTLLTMVYWTMEANNQSYEEKDIQTIKEIKTTKVVKGD